MKTKNKIYSLLSVMFLVAVIFFQAQTTQAAYPERIIDFKSDITVNVDGTLAVTETIKVYALGIDIRRGIYRDFPTIYRTDNGFITTRKFNVKEVKKDGAPEPYFFEKLSNGKRLYIGQEDVFLSPGEYTYTITYVTDRQLGFFEDHDELYWNVTGNGWTFEIEQAESTVHLPEGVPEAEIRKDGYTGPFGSLEKKFETEVLNANTIQFTTTESLDFYEGLSIVVGWPKGFVKEPTSRDQQYYFLRDNIGLLIIILGALGLFVFYLLAWARVGKDPKKGTIIPQYEPPQGFSPAALRYLRRMGYDNRVFTSSIIDLCVKGFLKIEEKDKKFTLHRTEKKIEDTFEEEKMIVDRLFRNKTSVVLKNTSHEVVTDTKDRLREVLKKQTQGYFQLNLKIFGIGLLVSALVVVLGFILSPVKATIWSVAAIIIMIILHVVFLFLMRRFTLEGRKLVDETEGFKWFLSVTEKDRMNFHNPPNRTPELFEKFLPYAIALGVEHAWSEQFAEVLAKAAQEGTYTPLWYAGAAWDPSRPIAFGSAFGGALSSAVSSASHAPGSSSGFGGGGGSGGGGGGGGGGGW